MSETYLSVVIPSYNEDKNFLRGVLDEVLSYLKKQPYEWELILSDDGSKKTFQEKLINFAKKDNRIRVLTNSHKGKAATVQVGMLAAKGDWVLFTDFDQSTPLKEVEGFFEAVQNGYEVMVGSREVAGAKRDEEPWYRHLMGRVFNLVVQTMAIPGIKDTQCGFKMFSHEAAQAIFSKLYVYGKLKQRQDAFTGAFDVEALYLAKKLGLKIIELPVFWQHHETNRVSPIKDSIRMFYDILKIRWAALRGKY